MDFINKAHQLAVTEHRNGNFEKAISFFHKALEANPQHPDLLSDRATSYLLLKKYHLALMDFDESARLDPKNGYRYASRAFAKEKIGDTKGAISDYNQAIALDPEDSISMNNLGLLMEYGGNKSGAKDLYTKADEMGLPSAVPGQTEPASDDEPLKEEKENFASVLNSIFTKKGFLEFLQFIKNGFKL